MAPRSAHRPAPKPRISRSCSSPPSHRLMQLLPRGVQELPRPPKEKPHRSSSWTSKSCYRCGSPGFGLDPASGRLECCVSRTWKGPRPIRPRQTRQTATAIAIPGKAIMKTFGKETPLPQQTRESHVGGHRKSNNRLPQARRCSRPLVFRLAGYSRGQVGNVTSPIQPDSKQFGNHVDEKPSAASYVHRERHAEARRFRNPNLHHRFDQTQGRGYGFSRPVRGHPGIIGSRGGRPIECRRTGSRRGNPSRPKPSAASEDAPEPDVAEVHTKQFPEDDVPSEYLRSD